MSSVQLRPPKAGPVRSGHPWIFSGALASEPDVDPGGWVEVGDGSGTTLGWGLYSPSSQIRVRIVAWGEQRPPLEAEGEFWVGRLRAAMRRRGLSDGGPVEARRLVNAEGDGLPGLTVDLFGPVAVVQISTLPMARRRQALMEAIVECVRPAGILMADSEAAARLEGFEPARGWWGEPVADPVEFVDGGLRYRLDSSVLQKTGHYLDVREHRRWVAQRAADKRVFDGFCFTGGFSLSAAAAGAARTLGVDSSASAVELAEHNARNMGLDPRCDFVRSDVFDKLRSCSDRRERFDIVVLDPPKYAPRARDKKRAWKTYTALAMEGLRVVDDGGIFGLSSCSHHIGEGDLLRIIATSSARRGRIFDVIHVGGHDGDHPFPAAMTEGRYLTFAFCQERF